MPERNAAVTEPAVDEVTVEVGYENVDGDETFAIRQKGKSRRAILFDRDGAEKVHAALGHFLSFGSSLRPAQGFGAPKEVEV